MDRAGGRPQQKKHPRISKQIGPADQAGLKTGVRRSRALVLRPAWVAGPNSLTKLCLEGFLLSNLKGRAMVPTPKLKHKTKNKIMRFGQKFAEFCFGDQ